MIKIPKLSLNYKLDELEWDIVLPIFRPIIATKNFDTIIKKLYKDNFENLDGVLWINDNVQTEVATFPIIDEDFNYSLGLDFSNHGINMCKERCKKDCFNCDNIYNINFDMIDFDIAISLEVFEHLEKDIYVINKIPKNKRIIFSVPSFDDIAHVRFFKNENEIIDRFKNLFVEFNVYILDKIFNIDAKR